MKANNKKKDTKGRFWETFFIEEKCVIWEESVTGMCPGPCHEKGDCTAVCSVRLLRT